MTSGATESSASCARVETISSESSARTQRISTRSGAGKCAPVVQMAIFRSRGARPWRNSSMTSGLRVSTGRLPEIAPRQGYCTGPSRRPGGRHRFTVQFQQHRAGVAGGDDKFGIRSEMMVFAGIECAVKDCDAIGLNGYPCFGAGRHRKVEGHLWSCGELGWIWERSGRGGGSGRNSAGGGARCWVLHEPVPGMDATVDEPRKDQKRAHDENNRHPERRGRDAVFYFLRGMLLLQQLRVGIVSKIVLGQKGLLVEAEIAGNGANKAPIENPAGQLVPVFIFKGFQEAWPDARRQGYFFRRHFAQFAFAF